MALPANTVEVLLSRGDALVATGNIAAARLLFERGASAGSARAMSRLAKMYDPEYLANLHVKGIEPNKATAVMWYREAAALSDPEAEARLEQLTAQASN